MGKTRHLVRPENARAARSDRGRDRAPLAAAQGDARAPTPVMDALLDTTATVLEKRQLTDVTTLLRHRRAARRAQRRAGPVRDRCASARRASACRSASPTSIATPGTITIVVQVVGKTSALICALEEGDELLDVAGPLGQPVDAARRRATSCCVGGGFGAGAIFPLARELRRARRARVRDRRRAHARARDPARPARARLRRRTTSAPTTGRSATTDSSPAGSRSCSPPVRATRAASPSGRCR